MYATTLNIGSFKNVRRFLDSVGSGVQMDATTPNNVELAVHYAIILINKKNLSDNIVKHVNDVQRDHV